MGRHIRGCQGLLMDGAHIGSRRYHVGRVQVGVPERGLADTRVYILRGGGKHAGYNHISKLYELLSKKT